MKTHSKFKTIALNLLQIKEVPTTEVCEYIYGSKSKKSTLKFGAEFWKADEKDHGGRGHRRGLRDLPARQGRRPRGAA